MARYRNTTKSDLTFADGKTVPARGVADVEPKTLVEQAWVASGALVCLDEPAKEPEPVKEPAKEPASAKTTFSPKK